MTAITLTDFRVTYCDKDTSHWICTLVIWHLLWLTLASLDVKVAFFVRFANSLEVGNRPEVKSTCKSNLTIVSACVGAKRCNLHQCRKYFKVNLINFNATDHLKVWIIYSLKTKKTPPLHTPCKVTNNYLQLLFYPGPGQDGRCWSLRIRFYFLAVWRRSLTFSQLMTFQIALT